ncbi:MAG: YciI family protein [Ilumatobacteraceae bacterium]
MDPETMQTMFADVEVFNESVRQAGAWVYANGLMPAETATVVDASKGDTVITDGPYLETKEHIGGFWIIDVADLDAALAWAVKGSVACRGAVEVRPFQSDAPAPTETT